MVEYASATNQEGEAPKHKPTDEELAEIHRKALKNFLECDESDRDNRIAAVDDQKFRAGEQWDVLASKERLDDGRPCLTINRMPQFIRQVTGDLRQNKPAIKVRPVEEGDTELAAVYTGQIRHIEQQSDADTAYVTAADHAATSGMGNFRIDVQYCDDDTFNQEIRIKRIMNPFAVWWDALAQEIDRSDARFCFVVDRISKDAFKERYPKATVGNFDGDSTTSGDIATVSGWFGSDTVRIAEYWLKKIEKKKIGQYADGSVHPVDSDEAKALGKPLKTREAEEHKICQYLMSGSEILEGPNEWAGKYIPIVPVIGEEVPIGDKIVRHGLVRFAKDPQRAFNYMRSASVEAIALQPKAPFTVTKDQIKGYEDFWDNAGKKNFPYLPYNPDPRSPGAPARVQPAVSANGMMEEAAMAADDMKAVTGIYDAALGARSNETSGRAIIARDRQGDTGTYVYIDNLSKAIAHGGRILVDLIPKIYDTERIIRTLGEDGTEAAYIMNRMMRDQQGQEVRMAIPIDQPNAKPILMEDDAKYDVSVTTGPSYATKRVEAADSMLQLVQAVPQVGMAGADLIVKNMDLPGGEQLAERLKKMLPPGMVDPDPNEPPPPEPPPPPEMVKMQMEQQAAQQKLEATAQANAAALQAKERQYAVEAQGEMQKIAIERDKAASAIEIARIQAAAEMQLMRDRADLEMQIMIEKANLARDIERDREAAKAKAEADAEMGEMHVAERSNRDAIMADAASQGIQAGMAHIAQAMLMPKRVVKNQSGEITGIEPVTGGNN